jgi:uroporphyrinogen decarboxylase
MLKMKDAMQPRERVRSALRHQETDRTPFDLGFGINQPALEQLQRYWGIPTLGQLHAKLADRCDIRSPKLAYTGPSHRNTVNPDGSQTGIWGVVRKPVSYGSGSYDEISHYPLAAVQTEQELDAFEWPSPDWWRVDDLADQIKQLNRDKEHAIRFGNGNIFETTWYMRGLEQTLIDLLTEPELIWSIMSRVTDYYIGYFRKVLEAADGNVDIVFTADDIGQQQGLLLSLDLWERMIKPHHIRLNQVLHEYGVSIMYHSDGAVMEAIPGLIDMGIDILEALQFDAKGMDPVAMKNAYGDRLCFHGGVSVQSTLPYGTPEQVRAEVQARKRILGRQGGYILAPSHKIQAGTPPENIAAFLDEAINKISLLSKI